MRYIAHRGLFNGPDKLLENRPEQIELALQKGYDCEVDLWVVNSECWLGHDGPQYLINESFLNHIGLWIHAKNLAALRWLRNTSLNYFWHENDKFTLTSHNWIWTNPGNDLTSISIMVMPEVTDSTLSICKNTQCYAICSDFVEQISLDRRQ
jgi:hypothetical protein